MFLDHASRQLRNVELALIFAAHDIGLLDLQQSIVALDSAAT
jgi:hypothetical protein